MLALILVATLSAASPEPAVRAVIEASAQDWNRGDLDGFMRSYEDSPETAMLTSKGPVRGWRALRDRYQANYGGKAKAGLGRLSFTDLEVRVLDGDWAIAYGRFHLVQDPAKPEQTGVFDLLMHRTAQGWRIASDHTS